MGSQAREPKFTLYGMEASLYTARPRSYMRMNAVPFKEVRAGSAEFTEEVVPKIGRWIIPVLKTPSGRLIQDGADIIDYLDAEGFSKSDLYPSNPILRTIAHVFEIYGCHGLLRPAMHYRWSFDSVNLPFMVDTFRDVLPDGLNPEQRKEAFLHASGRMRKAAVAIGVTDETKATVERSYAQWLLLLNKHLEEHPFVLGGHATIADYGLIGSMYAHLARDPVPLRLMQTNAPRVFRWVERMKMAETFEDESLAASQGMLIDPNDLPKTLLDLLHFISYDYLPEISAHAAHANEWLAANPEVEEGTSTKDKALHRGLGKATFGWHGKQISSLVLPYRFFLLGRLQRSAAGGDEDQQKLIGDLFSKVGLGPILELKTYREVFRADNHEVWGELQ